MIATLKLGAPFVLYVISIIFVLRALVGKTEWPLLYLIAIFPLRNVVDKLHMFPMGKDITDLLVIALLFGTFVRRLSGKKKMLVKSPINLICIILVTYLFISLLQGADYLNAYLLFEFSDPRVQAWKNFCILPLMFFITLNNVDDKKSGWRIIFTVCLSMVLTNYYLVQQISWYSGIVSRDKINATFVFLGPNEIAAFYNQYTIILMGIFFFMKKNIKKLALLGLIAVNIYCILFLFSRGAYIGFMAGCFFLFAVKNKKLLIPLILIALFWQKALPATVQERILMTTNEYGELDQSSKLRLVVWQHSLDLFSQSPITGVGYGVFSKLGYELGDTHNIYLKILAEQGLIGIVIFLLLLFLFFIQGIKLFLGGDDDLSKGLGLGFSICIIVLLVNNMFGDRWTYTEVSSHLWVFAGLVAKLNFLSIKTSKKSNTSKKPKLGTFKST